MDKYNVNRIEKRNKKTGKGYITLTIDRKNETPMIISEIKALYKEIQNKNKSNKKILVMGSTITNRSACLKSFNENSINMLDDEDDYFEGKVKDSSKFKEFYRLEFIY